MNLFTTITIERDQSALPITVIRGLLHTGYYTHPETGEETDYALTESEQDEAREKFSKEESLDDEPDDHTGHFANRRKSDQAAAAYFGHISGQRDRRHA